MNLQEILKAHKAWLETGQKEGRRANLEGMHLMNTNLEGVDLRRAHLERPISKTPI